VSRRNALRKQRQRTELAGARAYLDYRRQADIDGCRNARCTERGRPEFAVWWKCPAGCREEVLYCGVHGPAHLALALGGPVIGCRCGDWMSPMIEGLTA